MQKIILTLLFSFFLIFSSISQTVDVKSKSGYTAGWGTYKAKRVSLLPNFTPVNHYDDHTKYGSCKNLRSDSTGFFYVKKIDGRWWLIDPEGYAGINRAVTSFTSSNIQRNYDIVKKNGFNATGNFLSSESQTKSGYNLQNYHQFAYTRRLNFFLSYKNARKNFYETPTSVQGSLNHILVLDPQFAEYCDQICSTSVQPYVTERDLLGWFTDNEINFNQDQLRNLVKDLPAGDPSRDAALAFATSKGLTESDCINYTSKVTEAIKQEFAVLLAEHYFKTVAEAIRKYDTNHLILGSRFHGRPRAIQGVVNASHKYMDVTSVNFYDTWQPSNSISKDSWTNDHPCLVGEFYIKDITVFNKAQSGAGWYVENQTNRGYFYQNACLDLLANKCFVGWHYFRFEDDTDSNKGIVNAAGTEYAEMTKYMDELNKNVYRLCDYYDQKQRVVHKDTSMAILSVTEDTYIQAGASNNNTFGSAQDLEVQYNVAEANRREAYFKFSITSDKDLTMLKNAIFSVSITDSDATSRYVFAGGIADLSWTQNTLSGALRNENADWKNGYNRLSFVSGVMPSGRAGRLNFDVTHWLSDHPDQKTVSFKIFDIIGTNSAIKIASSKHETVSYRPALQLTFYEELSSIPTTIEPKLHLYRQGPSLFIEGLSEVSQCDFYGIDGKKMHSFILYPGEALDISTLAKGYYLLSIHNRQQQQVIKSIF